MVAAEIFGIMPMIIGSFYITIGAVLLASPIGILTAVFMTYFSNNRINRVMKPAVALLAGIPSVVYGFFGMMLLVPLTKDLLNLSSGKCVLVASVLLAIMVLPTIIQTSAALSAVPGNIMKAALLMQHMNTLYYMLIPQPVLAFVMLSWVAGKDRRNDRVIMVADQQRMPYGIKAVNVHIP